MKKSIVLVLAMVLLLLSFTASVNADIMNWTDRQSLDDKLESKPIGDADPWEDLRGGFDPSLNDNILEDIVPIESNINVETPTIKSALNVALQIIKNLYDVVIIDICR